jgi:transcription elongation factor GreA
MNFPITITGFTKMKAEIEDLKSVQRPAVIKAIAEAREHGDLKENAEYHAAREKQSFIEGRIIDLEDKLARAQIVDASKISDTKVRFGATVSLFNIANDREEKYQLVSEYEADLSNGLISMTSPIARGLIGKEAGDEIEIATPMGKKSYEIVNIEYK